MLQLKSARDESGFALVAVMAIISLASLVIALLTGILLTSLSLTEAAQVKLQSQMAAEAGIADGRAKLLSNICSTSWSRTSNPKFTVTVYRKSGASWVQGCPIPTSTQVKLVSQGFGVSGGIQGVNAENTSTVEATFGYRYNGISRDGNAMLTYGSPTFNDYQISPTQAEIGQIYTSNGDFDCGGTSKITGNVVVKGKAVLSGGCQIWGNLWVRDSVDIKDSAYVTGVVTSYTSGVTVNYTSATVYAQALGGIESATTSYIYGKVQGTIETPATLRVDSTAIFGAGSNIRLLRYQDLYYKPDKTWLNSSSNSVATSLQTAKEVSTQIATSSSGMLTPEPGSTTWFHFRYDYSEWQNAGFIEEVTWPNNQCVVPNLVGSGTSTIDVFWNQLEARKNNYVINVLNSSCSTIGGDFELEISSDVAIVAPKFSLQTLKISSKDGKPHSFWLLVQDGVNGSSSGPDCTGIAGEHINISGVAIISSPIEAMAYGPCLLTLPNGSSWRGQIYAGSIGSSTGQRIIAYRRLGLPGMNSGASEGLKSNVTLDIQSFRDLIGAQ